MQDANSCHTFYRLSTHFEFCFSLKFPGLGEMATISAVLYANTNHPELKATYPNWSDRCKQILKKWRALQQEKKAPFLQQARDNRSALRMKKAQQVGHFVFCAVALFIRCHLFWSTSVQILYPF